MMKQSPVVAAAPAGLHEQLGWAGGTVGERDCGGRGAGGTVGRGGPAGRGQQDRGVSGASQTQSDEIAR